MEEALPGQLYKYILEFSKNSFSGKVELHFDKRSLGKEGLIQEMLVETLEKADPAIISRLIDDLNLRVPNIKDAEIWSEFVDKFGDNVEKMVKVIESLLSR